MSSRDETPLAGITRALADRHQNGALERRNEDVVVEEPLEIRIAGDPFVVTMRTPGHDHELAAGLLMAEGLITSRADLGTMRHCGTPGTEGYGNVLDVLPAPGTVIDVPEATRRELPMTASCGVCGRQSIETLLARAGELVDETRISADRIIELSRALIEKQPNFARTGGLHAAGVAEPEHGYSHVREDVGRHNAVDKALGRLLLDNALPAQGRVLLVSGRTSFEIVHKAWMAEVPVLISVSAPSSLAIATAERAGITLIGFSRGPAFNVYANGQRVVSP